jgi:hypothetical protein
MHRLAYFNRGLMAAMIADSTASFCYQASLPNRYRLLAGPGGGAGCQIGQFWAACVIAAITAPDYGRVAAGAGSLCRVEPRSAPVRRQETGLRFGR